MSTSTPFEVCVLTPPGRGAVAVIIAAGTAAPRALGDFFRPVSATPAEQLLVGRIYHGRWGAADGEEVVVCRTGDTEFEIHCHGGAAAVARIIEDLTSGGAKCLAWRDWLTRQSRRSVEQEALAALAEVRTERCANILLDQWHGALAAEIRAILADCHAHNGLSAAARLRELIARAAIGLHLTQPFHVALAGRPNVGKSSLTNALVGYERAIVFDVPGTTRDIVTADTAIDGWPVQLSDMAGLRESDEALESAGVQKARSRLKTTDLVILVQDASQSSDDDEALRAEFPAALVIANKCDLAAGPPTDGAELLTSAVTGAGIAELLQALGRRLVSVPPTRGAAVPFTKNQRRTLQAALDALAGDDFQLASELLAPLAATTAAQRSSR